MTESELADDGAAKAARKAKRKLAKLQEEVEEDDNDSRKENAKPKVTEKKKKSKNGINGKVSNLDTAQEVSPVDESAPKKKKKKQQVAEEEEEDETVKKKKKKAVTDISSINGKVSALEESAPKKKKNQQVAEDDESVKKKKPVKKKKKDEPEEDTVKPKKSTEVESLEEEPKKTKKKRRKEEVAETDDVKPKKTEKRRKEEDNDDEEEEEPKPPAKKGKKANEKKRALEADVEEEVANDRPKKKLQLETSRDDRRVFIGGLPWRAEEDKLWKDLGECGEIEDLYMLKDTGGNFKGACFVTFADTDGVEAVLKKNDQEYDGRYLRVNLATNGKGGKKGKGKGEGKGEGKGDCRDSPEPVSTPAPLNVLPESSHVPAVGSDCDPKMDDDDVRVVRGINGTKKVEIWRSFEDVKFPPDIIRSLTKTVASFLKPSNVQAYTWPSLMAGSDVIGVAKTGSGKTLSFLLPGFIRIKETKFDAYSNGPKIVVLAPTRELCQQIYEESDKFGKPNGIISACAYGGQDRWTQLRQFNRGPHVAIACPGRLLDYLQRQQVWINKADYFVLDEADRMLDMGFEPDIREVITFLPKEGRQNCFFSATWPREVQSIARSICSAEAIHIQVGTDDGLTANRDIRQHVHIVDGTRDKWKALKELLTKNDEKTQGKGSVILFSNFKRECDDLAEGFWSELNRPCIAIHGDMTQYQRDRALQRFKSGEEKLIIATDVAQRGLDVRNVSMVVNWGAPKTAEDYVHRIGRTGRAGVIGESHVFLNPDDNKMGREIMKLMMKSGQPVPDELRKIADRGKGGGKGRGKGKGGSNRRWW